MNTQIILLPQTAETLDEARLSIHHKTFLVEEIADDGIHIPMPDGTLKELADKILIEDCLGNLPPREFLETIAFHRYYRGWYDPFDRTHAILRYFRGNQISPNLTNDWIKDRLFNVYDEEWQTPGKRNEIIECLLSNAQSPIHNDEEWQEPSPYYQ